MSYAMRFAGDRPPVAGVLAFRGFVPVWRAGNSKSDDRQDTRAYVAHGRDEPVSEVVWRAAMGS